MILIQIVSDDCSGDLGSSFDTFHVRPNDGGRPDFAGAMTAFSGLTAKIHLLSLNEILPIGILQIICAIKN